MARRSMNVMLIAAVVSGLIAAAGIYRMVATGASVEAAPQEIPVVVARADIEKGTVLSSAHLGMVSRSASGVPQGIFTDPKSVVGRIVRDPIRSGEAVEEGRLVAANRSASVSEIPSAPIRSSSPTIRWRHSTSPLITQ